MFNKTSNFKSHLSTLPLFTTLFVFFCDVSPACGQLLEGSTLAPATLQDVVAKVGAGSILILGESHGLAAHRDQHIAAMQALKNFGRKVSVALEFINYTDQTFVDQYVTQQLPEAEFLKDIQWQGIDFQFYKQQLLFSQLSSGYSVGINLPRAITSKLAKTGLASLSQEEARLLPPSFQLGRDSYKQRFTDVIHVPSGPVLDRYFLAQSAWDDTMAWQSTEFMKAHPEQVLVIVVGEFHAQYGGGLADRIRARDALRHVVVLSQINAINVFEDGHSENFSDEQLQEELKVSAVEGPRGDFIWLTKLPTSKIP